MVARLRSMYCAANSTSPASSAELTTAAWIWSTLSIWAASSASPVMPLRSAHSAVFAAMRAMLSFTFAWSRQFSAATLVSVLTAPS